MPWKETSVSIVQEAKSAPQPVWWGLENLAPLGFNPQTIQPLSELRLKKYLK
jgi:hypothetical protein